MFSLFGSQTVESSGDDSHEQASNSTIDLQVHCEEDAGSDDEVEGMEDEEENESEEESSDGKSSSDEGNVNEEDEVELQDGDDDDDDEDNDDDNDHDDDNEDNEEVSDLEEDIYDGEDEYPPHCNALQVHAQSPLLVTQPPRVFEKYLLVQKVINTTYLNFGFRICGDNIDKSCKTRFMRMDRRNQSLHYFHSYGVQNRIDVSQMPYISAHKTYSDVNVIANSILPSIHDDDAIKCNIATLVSRVL